MTLSFPQENRLAYTTLHTEFEAWIDSKLEKWLIDVGASGEDLFAALREVGETGTLGGQALTIHSPFRRPSPPSLKATQLRFLA